MKYVLCALSILTLTACSSVSTVHYPMADGNFKVMRSVSDPHAFAPTSQRSWLETCAPKVEKASEPDLTNCTDPVDPRYATVSGYADGIGSAVVHSAGFVGGMYLLGAGIADSGTTVQQQGGGASQQQGQGQAQGQHMRQSQGQSQYMKK